MCGLVGVYGYIGDKERKLFQDLLDLDVIRGHHSTGVAFIPEDDKKNPTIVKDVVLPYELMMRDDFRTQLAGQNLAIIGHNRAATRGEINADNAHPFTHGSITLAHNGTLTGKWRLPDHKNFGTDSEALCHSVNVQGIAETYKNLEGAAALSWWDDQEFTLNLITNGERPLHACVINEGMTLVWSSLNDVLKTCVNRRSFKVSHNAFYKLNDHTLFSFSLDKDGQVCEVSSKLSPFPKVIERYSTYGYSVGYGHQSSLFQKEEKKKEAPQESLNPDKKGPYGSSFSLPKIGRDIISRDRFAEMFEKVNCVFCGSSVHDEYGVCTVIDESTVACEDCTGTANDFGINIA